MIFASFILQTITTLLLFTSLQGAVLLPANIFEHVLAVVTLAGLALVVFGLIVKKEYRGYQFSWWDIIVLIIAFVTVHDAWLTLVTPHPIFHDSYYI